jgi:acetyltransferase-like isoleucine patch superfamily enzyme
MTDAAADLPYRDVESIPANVRLGAGCTYERLGTFSRINSRRAPALIVGDRVVMRDWTTFSIEGDGLIEIGDDCLLVGALFMVNNHVVLGRGVVVGYNVTIADCDFHPRDPDQRRLDAQAIAPHGNPGSRPSLPSRPVVIDDGAWIGMSAMILKGVHIGSRARIAPGCVVTSHVPAGAAMAGNPGRLVEENPFGA